MSVTVAKGFVASGVHCGIRKAKPDLAVVRSLAPATGAAMFTANRVQAAPVVVSKEHLGLAQPQAVVANSGVANAATGLRGELDARATAAEAARLLGPARGGGPRPFDRRDRRSAPARAGASGPRGGGDWRSPGGGADAAEAILTTDTRPKEAVANGPGFAVGGMAKGSGMIHPNLATMLAVVTTDYPLAPGEALEFSAPAVAESFNSISVDGECSTNDTVVLLSSGASEVERDDAAFATALRNVCRDLATQVVADGEGATVLAEVEVAGAATQAEARAIAGRIATSPLVKTCPARTRRELGPHPRRRGSAPYNGGYAQLDPARATLVSTAWPSSRTAARARSNPCSTTASA